MGASRRASTFEQRLAASRAYVASRKTAGMRRPDPVADQLAAATDHARALQHEVIAALLLLQPGRWHSQYGDGPPPDEIDARILIALAECPTICPHLRRGGPQPAWAVLPLHRLDCTRCQRTVRRPPPGEEDRCDWCGAGPVTVFTPVAIQRGPLIVGGDACPSCAAVLLDAA